MSTNLKKIGILSIIFITIIFSLEAREVRKKIGLDMAASTLVPVSMGVLAEYRVHKNVHLGLDVGYMPSPYVDLMNTINENLGAYGESTSAIISNSLQNSFVFSPHAKFFPIKKIPFYVTLGYTLVALGAGINTLDSLSVVFPDFADTAVGAFQNSTLANNFSSDIPVTTILHNAKIGAGVKHTFRNNIFLTGELAFFKSFYSSTIITDSNLNTLESELDYYMNDLYITYITIPVIGFAVGYSF